MTCRLGRIGFIGAGRLGQTLAVAFTHAGETVVGVQSRRDSSAQELAHRVSLAQRALSERPDAPAVVVHATAQSLAEACDTVFITVHDDQIAPVASGVNWRAGQVAVHCSGATELQALQHAVACGGRSAGFHPLHTFGDVDTALSGLPGCAVAVEAADAGLRQALTDLAQALGTRPFELPPGSRALYHASAHFAGSLVVTLMDEAVRHWARFGVERENALASLLPLLRSTVRAIEARGLGPGMAGVAARGDALTLASHLQAMAQAGPDEYGLYAELTRRSVRLALQSGRITETQAQAMCATLDAERRS